MMRLARYTRDPMTDIQTGVTICIRSEATRQASKHRLVSECIPGLATRTGEASIGRVTEPNRHPYHHGQQKNALCKEPRAPLLPSWQTVGILKRNASTRPVSTAYQLSRFSGLRLSLR